MGWGRGRSLFRVGTSPEAVGRHPRTNMALMGLCHKSSASGSESHAKTNELLGPFLLAGKQSGEEESRSPRRDSVCGESPCRDGHARPRRGAVSLPCIP